MSFVSKLKSLFKSNPKEILHVENDIPEGYVSLYDKYSHTCGNLYINNKGIVYNRAKDYYYPAHRYLKLYGIYHYLPKMMLRAFHGETVLNIHQIHFKDNDRNNYSENNLTKIDIKDIGYFTVNTYSQEIKYNTQGTLRREEYIVYMKDLLDHNWTHLFKEWLDKNYPLRQCPDMLLAELVVDIQEDYLEFNQARKGTPLAQPIKGKIVYKVICDTVREDFWIIPPKKKSNLRDIVRYFHGYILKTA